jgi:hypothetical protein
MSGDGVAQVKAEEQPLIQLQFMPVPLPPAPAVPAPAPVVNADANANAILDLKEALPKGPPLPCACAHSCARLIG